MRRRPDIALFVAGFIAVGLSLAVARSCGATEAFYLAPQELTIVKRHGAIRVVNVGDEKSQYRITPGPFRVSPRQFSLEPGERQTVRILKTREAGPGVHHVGVVQLPKPGCYLKVGFNVCQSVEFRVKVVIGGN